MYPLGLLATEFYIGGLKMSNFFPKIKVKKTPLWIKFCLLFKKKYYGEDICDGIISRCILKEFRGHVYG